MELRALLLTKDEELIEVLQRALADLGIGAEVYSSASWATDDIQALKFDAVIVDFDVDGANEFLRTIHSTASNARTLTFAIVSQDTGLPAAFEMGANLALQKPITLERARSSLRAAYGLIMQERRRYFRYAVETDVQVCPDEKTTIHATAINLSEGGMALKSSQDLQMNGLFKLYFKLPGLKQELELKAVVVWKDQQGRAGLRFEPMSSAMRQRLSEWVLAQVVI